MNSGNNKPYLKQECEAGGECDTRKSRSDACLYCNFHKPYRERYTPEEVYKYLIDRLQATDDKEEKRFLFGARDLFNSVHYILLETKKYSEKVLSESNSTEIQTGTYTGLAIARDIIELYIKR